MMVSTERRGGASSSAGEFIPIEEDKLCDVRSSTTPHGFYSLETLFMMEILCLPNVDGNCAVPAVSCSLLGIEYKRLLSLSYLGR